MVKLIQSCMALILFIAGSVATDTAIATQRNSEHFTYVSEVTGMVLEFANIGIASMPEPAEIVGSNESRTELITLVSDTTYVDFIFATGEQDLGRYEESLIAGFAGNASWADQIEGAATNNSMWGLYTRSYYLDYRQYMFAEATLYFDGENHLAIRIYSPQDDIATDFTWVQNNATINGQRVINHADQTQVEAAIDGTSTFQPIDLSVTKTSIADWSDQGLVSNTVWQGPLFNTEFSWDEDLWQFTFNRDDAIVISTEYNDEMLILETPDRRGMTKLRTMETNDTPAGWVEWWLSDDYREADSGFIFTVVDSATTDTTGSVILRFETVAGEPVVVIRDVYVNEDNVTIMTEIFAAPEDIAQVYTDFWDGVQSNGDYYPLTWTIEDIESLDIEQGAHS